MKLGQIYDLKSFDSAKDTIGTFDGEGGIILGRNLEYVSKKVFEQRVAGATFLNQGITVNNEGGYANAITKLKKTINGDFKLSGSNTNGNGKISLSGEDDSIQVFGKEANSDWSETELKQAELENRNLVTDLLGAHDKQYKRNIDTIGYLGQAGKTAGLLNNGVFGFTTASTKLSDMTSGIDMFNMVRDLIEAQRTAVFNDEVLSCNRVTMHQSSWNILTGTILNSAGGTDTVMTVLRKTYPEIQFGLTNKAEIGGKKRIVAYSANEDALQFRLPVALQISNTFQQGFKYYVESMYRIAGLDIIEDTAGFILDDV